MRHPWRLSNTPSLKTTSQLLTLAAHRHPLRRRYPAISLSPLIRLAPGRPRLMQSISRSMDTHTRPVTWVHLNTAGTNSLLVGGPNGRNGSVSEGINDFTINITSAVGGTPSYFEFAYTSSAHPNGLFEGNIYDGGSISSQVIPTPLPSSLILLLCGGATLVVFARSGGGIANVRRWARESELPQPQGL